MPTHTVNLDLCRQIAQRHPYPLLFATISGAHLYGFASADSDYDLRGVHILPAAEALGLRETRDTIESEGIEQGVEIDLVTHDAAKFFRLLLRKNGYVLEQLLSPHIVLTTPEHEELRALAPACITRFHGHHYLGFAQTQWRLFEKETPPRVKPLLYVYRVLLTGIHLMRTGELDANLPSLNAAFRLPYIDELIERKTSGAEKETLTGADVAVHESEYTRLRALLETEMANSTLPDSSTALPALNDLLIRLRLGPQPR